MNSFLSAKRSFFVAPSVLPPLFLSKTAEKSEAHGQTESQSFRPLCINDNATTNQQIHQVRKEITLERNHRRQLELFRGRGGGRSELPLERMEMPASNHSAATVIGWERARTVFPTHGVHYSGFRLLSRCSSQRFIYLMDFFARGRFSCILHVTIQAPWTSSTHRHSHRVIHCFVAPPNVTPPIWTPTCKIKERS